MNNFVFIILTVFLLSCTDRRSSETDDGKNNRYSRIDDYDLGYDIYGKNCTSCHQRANLKSVLYPPSVQDLWNMKPLIRVRAIDSALNNSVHKIYFKNLNDSQLKALLNYLNNPK